MVVILIIIIASVIGIGSAIVTHKADGPVEQAAEAVIEKELGLPEGSVDLTPEEKK